jgi:TolB protein
MWAKENALHFLHKKLSGNLSFTMDVAWPEPDKENHRKVCALVRATLDADSPYVDVAVHGDGLIGLQYRKTKGGDTYGIRTPLLAPATVKLERDGDVFTVSAAKKGGPSQPVGAVSVALPDPVCVGLGVTAHNSKTSRPHSSPASPP